MISSEVFLARQLMPFREGNERADLARTFDEFNAKLDVETKVGMAKVLAREPEYGVTAFVPLTPTSPLYVVVASHPINPDIPIPQTLDEHPDPLTLMTHVRHALDALLCEGEEDGFPLEAVTVTQHIRPSQYTPGSLSRGFPQIHFHIEGHVDYPIPDGFSKYDGTLHDLGYRREFSDPTMVVYRDLLQQYFPEMVFDGTTDSFILYTREKGAGYIDESDIEQVCVLMHMWQNNFSDIRSCLMDEENNIREINQRNERIEEFVELNSSLSRRSKRILSTLSSRITDADNAPSEFNKGINGTLSFFIDPKTQTQQLRFAPRTYRAPESQLAVLDGVSHVVVKDRCHQVCEETFRIRAKPYQNIISRL